MCTDGRLCIFVLGILRLNRTRGGRLARLCVIGLGWCALHGSDEYQSSGGKTNNGTTIIEVLKKDNNKNEL